MKLSARNQIKGKIVEVTKGVTTSHVRIDVGHGVIITSSITNEAVADLGLQKGDEAWAVIKASDVTELSNSYSSAAMKWVTLGAPANWKRCTASCTRRSALVTRSCWRRCSSHDSTRKVSTMRPVSAASSNTPQA